MKAHGIHQSQSTIRDIPVSSRPKATASAPSKKRKAMHDSDNIGVGLDDDESLTPRSVKKEPARGKVKKEPTTTDAANDAANSAGEVVTIKDEDAGVIVKDEPTAKSESKSLEDLQGPILAFQTDGADESSSMFNNFIHPEAFGTRLSVGQISLSGAFDPPAFNATSSAPQAGNGEAVHESILIAD